jgi:hypothetical protein
MKKRIAVIESEYGIHLGASYLIETPFLKNEWMSIAIYFDEVYALMENTKYELVKVNEFPIEIIQKTADFGMQDLVKSMELSLIDFCKNNDYLYLQRIETSHRDQFLTQAERSINNSIGILKKSFLTMDIVSFIVKNNLSSVDSAFNPEFIKSLIDFKKSEYGEAFQSGIDLIVDKFHSNYKLTSEIEQNIRDSFLQKQNELFRKTNIEDLKKLNLSALFEDGIGMVGGLIFPILPLGTIKEIFSFVKSSKEFKNDKELLFVLSIYYLQKCISKNIKDVNEVYKECTICSITKAEIMKFSEDQSHTYVFGAAGSLCERHLVAYLNLRKSKRLVGKELLMNLKNVS